MGRIQVQDGAEVPLRTHHLFGRSRAMHSTFSSSDVSAQHLSLSWDGSRWQARDLASRNGTRLDGVVLRPGEDAPLREGSVLELGSPKVRLVLVDAGPPVVIAQGEQGAVEGDTGFLALPSAEEPAAVILLEPDEGWICSMDAARFEIVDGQVVEVAGQRWRISLPSPLSGTEDFRSVSVESREVALAFRISSDEEYVEVSILGDGQAIPLPPRAHHYLLITLARARLEDAEQSEAEQGWVYTEQLRHQLRISSNQFHVSLHRLRKEAEATGLLAGFQFIEQRKTTRQIRLGVKTISITPL